MPRSLGAAPSNNRTMLGGGEDNKDQTPLPQGRAPLKGHLCPELPMGAFVATALLTPPSVQPATKRDQH